MASNDACKVTRNDIVPFEWTKNVDFDNISQLVLEWFNYLKAIF